MTTLTLEHPAKETADLLQTCDREGSVRIVAEGRQYLLRTTVQSRGRLGHVPDFEARLATVFPVALSAEQTAEADHLLAGE